MRHKCIYRVPCKALTNRFTCLPRPNYNKFHLFYTNKAHLSASQIPQPQNSQNREPESHEPRDHGTRYPGPRNTALHKTCTGCKAVRFVPSLIWVRQLVPEATMMVSSDMLAISLNKTNSPTFIDKSKCSFS